MTAAAAKRQEHATARARARAPPPGGVPPRPHRAPAAPGGGAASSLLSPILQGELGGELGRVRSDMGKGQAGLGIVPRGSAGWVALPLHASLLVRGEIRLCIKTDPLAVRSPFFLVSCSCDSWGLLL